MLILPVVIIIIIIIIIINVIKIRYLKCYTFISLQHHKT